MACTSPQIFPHMTSAIHLLASNIAQGGATLAVALKTKNSQLKQLASSSGFTAVMGITEPCLYGVLLRLKKPLSFLFLLDPDLPAHQIPEPMLPQRLPQKNPHCYRSDLFSRL